MFLCTFRDYSMFCVCFCCLSVYCGYWLAVFCVCWFMSCQYQCKWLPRKTRLWNDWLKGHYHENITFKKKWHTCTLKTNKIYGEPNLSQKKWTLKRILVRHSLTLDTLGTNDVISMLESIRITRREYDKLPPSSDRTVSRLAVKSLRGNPGSN